MAWLVSLLGAALALAGAVSLGNGASYIRLDWGQTETVAGTVALSAGIVTMAIGAVLFALRDIAARMAERPQGVGLEALTWSEEDAPVPRPLLGRVKSRLASVGIPKAAAPEPAMAPAPRPAEPVPSEDRPAPSRFDRPVEAIEPAQEPEPAYRSPPPVPPLPEPEPIRVEAPTVVGRYEANGASYVLFSDGTIEVETENGTHRFASMADLKAHIERQDTA